ncbi:MAG: methyltransferase type 11, partial [Burkholderiaceae bacterium]
MRFRAAGRGPYYFTRGKLGGDPVFAALLRDGRIKDGVRIVDVGCGLGIFAALLAAAEPCEAHSASDWPSTWAPPPKRWTSRGFDLRRDAIAAGQRALADVGDRVT